MTFTLWCDLYPHHNSYHCGAWGRYLVSSDSASSKHTCLTCAAVVNLLLRAAVEWWEGVNSWHCQKWRNTCRKASTWKQTTGEKSTFQTHRLLLLIIYTHVNRAGFLSYTETCKHLPVGWLYLNISSPINQDRITANVLSLTAEMIKKPITVQFNVHELNQQPDLA